MNKFKKLTVADWFIIVIILSLIFVVGAPLLRSKETKMMLAHGTFMCFVGKDGVLMQKNTSDKSFKTARPAPNGICSFKAPGEANILTVTLIAGGGGGSASQIAKGQRGWNFGSKKEEINLLESSLTIKNPFSPNVVDKTFKELVLNELAFATAGGGGGSLSSSNAVSGMGGICAIKGVDMQIGDYIERRIGQNGKDGLNGTDGVLIYKPFGREQVRMTAKGGLGIFKLQEGVQKDGNCEPSKYSAGHFRNESTKGVIAPNPQNQAFFRNFAVAKLSCETQIEKVRVIRGRAGERGEIISFNMKKPKNIINICFEDKSKSSKNDKKCTGVIGKGGLGGKIEDKNAQNYTKDLSGKNGESTKFGSKIAKGGLGGTALSNNFYYLEGNNLSLRGEDGKYIPGVANTGAMGGNCEGDTCDGKSATTFGESGAGASLLYKTNVPLGEAYVVKVLDSMGRQIGKEILLNKKQETPVDDTYFMGNGGDGSAGAIIIKW